MHTTWRGTLAHWLLAGGAVGSVALAVALTVRNGLGGISTAGWVIALLLLGGAFASWRHFVETERMRRSLGVGLTHHLRTSLTHIQTYNEMLLLGNESSEEQRREWLEVVGREAQRVGCAVENLLFLFQDRRSCGFPIRRSIDLGTLLEDVASSHVDGERRLRLDVDPPTGILVDADPTALRQALGNLFDSAARSALSGSTISGTAAVEGGTASVLLLFNADAERSLGIGDAWTGDDHRLEGEPGSAFGLELAVASHVARMHGGRATFVHDGTRSGYRVDLPLASRGVLGAG